MDPPGGQNQYLTFDVPALPRRRRYGYGGLIDESMAKTLVETKIDTAPNSPLPMQKITVAPIADSYSLHPDFLANMHRLKEDSRDPNRTNGEEAKTKKACPKIPT